MKQNVTITVRAAETTYTARGTMERDASGTRLAYDEPAELGLAGVRTALELSGERAVLRRTGAVRSELRFEVGRPHRSVYETAHGSFPAEVMTHVLRTKLDASGGLIDLRYTLTIGGAPDEHRLKILVRTENET